MKSRTTKIIIWLASIMAVSFMITALVLVFSGGISISKKQVDQSEVFDLSAIDNISIDTVSTDINIMATDGDQIKVDFYGQVSTNINKNKPELVVYQSQDKLNIEIVQPKGIYFGINIQDTVLDVYIPQNNFDSFSVSTTSGSCNIKQLEAENFAYNNVSGDLNAIGFQTDNSRLKSTSGDIMLTGYTGNIEARSISGDVILKDGRANENINVETTSGKVDIYQDHASSMDLSSISGEINIQMDRQAEFYLSIGTISGDIENRFPVSVTSASDRDLEGTVGNGDARVLIKTTSGDISIGYSN
ncbi:MAG: DUF4097 family beta strand repeat-containing protein [Actinomycetota bacterium]|nr:DUF4097 family beta strand repeat-containing protein [Actinomycetota bacterium]